MIDFIEKDFLKYNLDEFEEYKKLINICVSDNKNLYKLLPNLLRTLFENLLYRIFSDGLSSKHTSFYFLKSQARSRDLSELIAVLNILRTDLEIKKFHNDTITEKSIEYLNGIRKEGNTDTHAIITQLKTNYISEKKEDVKLLLDCLLHFYRNIKDKGVIVDNPTTLQKLDKKLRLSGAIQRQDAREIIENIKRMDKIGMINIIIVIDYAKLKEIIEKILAEISIIENYDECEDKQSLYDFTIYTIILVKDNQEKNEIFKLFLDFILDCKEDYYKIYKFQKKLPKILKIDSIKKFCVKTYMLKDFIQLFKDSNSYNQAGINAEIIYILREELNKDQINDIAKIFYSNRQIYESSKAKKIMYDLALNFQLKLTKESETLLESRGIKIPDILRF